MISGYYLSEDHRKGHTILDADGELYLVSDMMVYRVRHLLVIEDSINSRTAQGFIKDAQQRWPKLANLWTVTVDCGRRYFIFWVNESAPRINFSGQGWEPVEAGPALDAIEAGHLNRLAEHAASTGDRSADTEGACNYCDGTGVAAPGITCSDCDGTGWVDIDADDDYDYDFDDLTPAQLAEQQDIEAEMMAEQEAQQAPDYEPPEFPHGEFPDRRRWLDPDWGTY
jgi:hypothetical protein